MDDATQNPPMAPEGGVDPIQGDDAQRSPFNGKPVGGSRHLHRAMRALQRAGFAVSAASGEVVAAPDSSDGAPVATPQASSQVVGGDGFVEAVSRSGVTALVESANGIAQQVIESAASDLGGDAAKRFGERARMQPGVRDGLITSGVEICRLENVNLPPHATALVLVTGWLVGLRAVVKDIRDLKQEKPPDAS